MAASLAEPFSHEWARKKLDMPRRRRELTAYFDTWLPELRTMPKGLVIDIGCGPGDALALCVEMGHEALGIDAPEGRGGMGDAYLAVAREERRRLGVHVEECGAMGWIDAVLSRRFVAAARCVHMRGSIEQCFAVSMIGNHADHHDCKRLDWDTDAAPYWFGRLMRAVSKVLLPGGILLIAANGTKSTDTFYERAIQEAASAVGLRLTAHKPPLTHKWVMPAAGTH